MYHWYLEAIAERLWDRILLLVAVALLLWSLANLIYQYFRDPLKDIPGPTLARYTKLWLCIQYARGRFHKTNLELHKKYGCIVRIAPGQYSIDDPEAAKMIYAHGTQFTKSDWYEPWGHPSFINVFNDRNPKTHALLRRQLSHVYSMSSLVSYEDFVDDCVEILSQRLSEFAKSGTDIDMGHWLQCYAFDVIGKITFSYRFGFLDSGVDLMNLMTELDWINFYASLAGHFPFLNQFVAKLIRALKLSGQGTFFIDNYVQDFIKTCEQQGIQEHGTIDFVRKFLNMRKNEPAATTRALARNAANTNMNAGSDTTGISLSAIVYYLYKSPTTLAKLREELSENSQAGKISDPITFKEAQSLPYLQAIIKEALRIHPAVGFPMPRVVPAGGATMLGRYFPQGTVVGINSWVAHANKSVFGEDADVFRPERWLNTPEVNNMRDPYYFTFGQGSRTCIGKNISLLEISKLIPQLVRNFDFDMEGEDLWKCRTNWFAKPTNFVCRVKELHGKSK